MGLVRDHRHVGRLQHGARRGASLPWIFAPPDERRVRRRDWLANGVLFAGYHLHTPWEIPTTLLDTFILAYPSKRYRSALIGIAVHSAQSVLLVGLALSLVLKG